jgi:hypothetical protein
MIPKHKEAHAKEIISWLLLDISKAASMAEGIMANIVYGHRGGPFPPTSLSTQEADWVPEAIKDNPSEPWMRSSTYFLVSRLVYPQSADLVDQVNPKVWQTVDIVRKLSIEQGYALTEPVASVQDRTS